MILLTPHPGYFIQSEQMKSALELLNRGYMALTLENARMYGDSFYNTKTGGNINNLTRETIPGSIYINSFLKGHETLSKSFDELQNSGLAITPFNQVISERGKNIT